MPAASLELCSRAAPLALSGEFVGPSPAFFTLVLVDEPPARGTWSASALARAQRIHPLRWSLWTTRLAPHAPPCLVNQGF